MTKCKICWSIIFIWCFSSLSVPDVSACCVIMHACDGCITDMDQWLLVFFCGSKTVDYHGSNTIFLVGTLMSVVGGVFVVFATMALCYRSVVVHKNFSLCLRLVSRRTKVAIHVFSQHLASDYFISKCFFITKPYN